MFDELLPAIENSIINASGALPVIFEGIEHTLEKTTPVATSSRHSSHELLCLRSGRIEFTIDGNNTFVLEKGSILIIRPNTEHKVKVLSGQADMFVLYFGFSRDIDVAQKAISQMSQKKPEVTNKPHSGPSVAVPYIMAQTPLESFMDFATGEGDQTKSKHIIISGAYKKNITSIVERIVEESKGQMFNKELMMQIMTVELMVTLARAMKSEWEESLRVKNGKARELVLIAKEYIDQNFDRGISVADAASYVFLSQGYFTRAFRDELLISPMAYLMKKRIEKACELLENNEIKVSGVAAQTGFSSPQRFNVAFRKQTGMTPMEYRRKKQ
ncbi:MAG: helix-turn-helix domain-containing protein [Clostridiales bacterium]|nr:helix-turn-helix domain-containing protein [Clostridiales bacterium]